MLLFVFNSSNSGSMWRHLLINWRLGRIKSRLARFLHIYLLLFLVFLSARKLFRERITVETSVQPTSEGECVSGKKSRSAVSSWSPAAMTVTRTSASAELMAPDKCVMGSYQGQRFTAAAALHDRARTCLTACLTILHRRPDLRPPHARCISLQWAFIWSLTAAS